MSPFMRRLANGSVPRADEHFKKLVRLVRLVRELHAFPENARGVLRHDGVDVEAGAPFESRGLREPRRDLEMPVVLGLLAVAGGRVDVIVEGWVVEDAEHPTRISLRIRANGVRSSSAMSSKAISWAFGRIQDSNGNRAA